MQFAHLRDRAFPAAVADLKARIAEKEKTLDRRHKITVGRKDETDRDAIIGFDPPLRTFFLQAFMGCSYRELWLGTLLEEFTSLEAIIVEARAQGYEVAGMTTETVLEMTKLAVQPHAPSICEKTGDCPVEEGEDCKNLGFRYNPENPDFRPEMTKSISTTEFMSNFGKYHDEARQHPITLTKHGRPSVVVIAADLYERMTANSDPRRVYATGEMPRELADMFLTQLDADSAEFKGTEND